MTRFAALAATFAIVLATLPAPGMAGMTDDAVRLEVLPGWRTAKGTHVAGLRITLAPGWKTYWRAPGDAGIPPAFHWQGSRNLAAVRIGWPAPMVFDQNGMRSVGYADEVVIPVELDPAGGGDIRLAGRVDIGVCKDICIPETLRFSVDLPAVQGRPDPRIAAALADRPYSAGEAGVRAVSCKLSPIPDGMAIEARVTLPATGGTEHAVIEAGDPRIWVSEPETSRRGDVLTARSEMEHVDGAGLIIDRGAVRITILGASYAVDIQGCPAG